AALSFLPVVVIALATPRPAPAAGYTLTTLASFNGTNGSAPTGLIFDALGDLVGTATGGGANGLGSVFVLAARSPTILTLARLQPPQRTGPDVQPGPRRPRQPLRLDQDRRGQQPGHDLRARRGRRRDHPARLRPRHRARPVRVQPLGGRRPGQRLRDGQRRRG